VHEPSLRNDPIDADMVHAHQLGQAVRRDLHKMKSFVKFQTVHASDAHALQMAWHEPTHHILEAVAPWFNRRMPQQRWVVFTPERSVECDGRQLHFGPGVPRSNAPNADSPESRWLECYQGVFGARAIAASPTP
jgi:DNA polymerase